MPTGSTYNYEYNLADHLGNVRITFDTEAGVARAQQQDNYMPFGMDMSTPPIGSPQNYYLYNKKEWQTSLGLYDYGSRFYDPLVGRWTTVDPMAEIYQHWSAYDYGADNPINNKDPEGTDIIDFRLSVATRYVDPTGRTLLNTDDGRNGIYEVPWNMYTLFMNSIDNAGGFHAGRSYVDSREWNDFWRNSLPMIVSDYAMDHYAIGFTQLDDELQAKYIRALITGNLSDQIDFELSYAGSQWSDPVLVAGSLLSLGDVSIRSIPLTTDEILENVLRGKSPESVESKVGKTTNWKIEKLGRGSHKGQGWVLREYGAKGQATGRVIRWHPGGGHHGPEPYWKVSNGKTVSGEIK